MSLDQWLDPFISHSRRQGYNDKWKHKIAKVILYVTLSLSQGTKGVLPLFLISIGAQISFLVLQKFAVPASIVSGVFVFSSQIVEIQIFSGITAQLLPLLCSSKWKKRGGEGRGGCTNERIFRRNFSFFTATLRGKKYKQPQDLPDFFATFSFPK